MKTAASSSRYLSVYYFHGQDLCMVPRHVDEDIAWMRDHAVDGVCVGVHDADLRGGNTRMVCDKIRDAGLDLWIVPSRVGGLVAGWHRGPSFLSTNRPDLWALDRHQRPIGCFGPQVSVFHPETPAAVTEVVLEMIHLFGPSGVIWDELKTLSGEDHSQAAKSILGRPAGPGDMPAATAECMSRINTNLKRVRPDLQIAGFIYAHSPWEQMEICAGIEGLDFFGCDGKCWHPDECEEGEGRGCKVLLGGNDARFCAAARGAGRKHFTLLETQLLGMAGLNLTLRHLPSYLAEKEDHLAYYYYPCGMQDPDFYMPRIGRLIAEWRSESRRIPVQHLAGS